jgi:transposase-like protein
MRSIKIKDADLAKVESALLRAARQARRTAEATGTPFVVYKNNRTVRQAVVKENRPGYDA